MRQLIQPKKRRSGLAAMSLERRREIASKGGRTAQARGTAHQWTVAEARAAGKKGAMSRAAHKQREGGKRRKMYHLFLAPRASARASRGR